MNYHLCSNQITECVSRHFPMHSKLQLFAIFQVKPTYPSMFESSSHWMDISITYFWTWQTYILTMFRHKALFTFKSFRKYRSIIGCLSKINSKNKKRKIKKVWRHKKINRTNQFLQYLSHLMSFLPINFC